MEETLRSHLAELATRSGMTQATIGRRALNDSKIFSRLSADMGFNVRTYDRLVQWLSDNWPDGAEWPSDIPRPAPAREAAA